MGDDPAASALLTCLHLHPSDRKVLADTPSQVFSSGAAVQASSDVTMVSPGTFTSEEVTALKGPGGLTCLGEVIGQAVAAQGAAVSGASIQAIPAPTVVAEPTLAVRYHATFTLQGKSLTAQTDEYFIAHGASEVTATFTSYQQPFPTAVEQAVVARLVSRL